MMSSVAVALIVLCASVSVGGEVEEGATAHMAVAEADSLEAAEILAGYAAYLHRAMESVETLVVDQVMVEPQNDGTEKRSSAILYYSRGKEMAREETSSDIGYPAGKYTLQSLIGPTIHASEYEIIPAGIEEMQGSRCHRLELKAITRDIEHFDGTLWVSSRDFAPVRIKGKVSDPPFPVSEITLDKAFAPFGSGIWLLRRHSGEVELGLFAAKKRGLRHIFYDGYVLNKPLPPGSCLSGEGGAGDQ